MNGRKRKFTVKRKLWLTLLSVGMLLAAVLGLTMLTGCGATNADGEKTQIIRIALNQSESRPEYIALADFGENSRKRPTAATRCRSIPTPCWAIRAL